MSVLASSIELHPADESLGGPLTTADLTGQEDEEGTHDIEAQAGVPVVLPGAFSVRPINMGGDGAGQPSSGYDSGFEDASSVESADPEPQTAPEDPEEPAPIFRPVASTSPVEAELYEVNYADARVLTDTASPDNGKMKRQARKLKLALVLFCGLLGLGIALAVMYSTGGGTGACSGSSCAPEIRGWISRGDVLTGPTERDSIEFGFSVALSGDGNRLIVGLPGQEAEVDNAPLSQAGGVYILDFNGTNWVRTKEIQGREANANAGTSVAISEDGSRIAFGGPGAEDGGNVVVYEENADGEWFIIGEIGTNFSESASVAFGSPIALSADGNVLAIGDRYAVDEQGLADVGSLRIFSVTNSTWSQLGSSLYGTKENDLFAWSISLSEDGTRVAASSLGANGLKGQVRIFDFVEEDWMQVGNDLGGEQDRETFGASIALANNGQRLVVGATGYAKDDGQSGVGRVRIFDYDSVEDSWVSTGQPIVGDSQFDRFGSAVAISADGSTIAVGSPESDLFGENAGYIQVLGLADDDTWLERGSELGREQTDGGLYGDAISLSSDGSIVAGGAPQLSYDGKLSRVGQVWMYETFKAEG